MKKHNHNKTPAKKLRRVSKSNFKEFIGGYKSILPIGVLVFFLTAFVSINLRLLPSVDELPQTGEATSEVAFNIFVNNAQKFVSSSEGTLFLIFFFLSLITLFVYIASSSFPRRK